MVASPRGPADGTVNMRALLAYVADLELEVDHLRKQGQLLQQEARDALKRIRGACAAATAQAGDAAAALAQIDAAARELAEVLRDLQEPAGYHPSHDQVIAIAVRPVVEQVFRRQQRLAGPPRVALRLELETEHLEWFPARLRHVLENLFCNALKFRDVAKAESWVSLGVRVTPAAYELRVADNGLGLPVAARAAAFDLFYRAAPARAAGLGGGLAVVNLLVEQSGGSLTVDSAEGQGTAFVATLPRYDVDDYLE
jgi:signal transduction histidine kinase